MRVLRARLLERELAAQQAEQAAERKRPGRQRRALGEDPHLQLPAGPGDRPPGEAHEGRPAEDPRRGARRLHRGARGGREAPQARVRRARRRFDGDRRDALGGRASRRSRPRAATRRELDAQVLIADALGIDRGALVTEPARPVPPAAARVIGERVRRRAQREPVAYILGSKGFRHIELAVDCRVLVPRPETELLVEVALEPASRRARARRRHGLGRRGAGAARRACGPARDAIGRLAPRPSKSRARTRPAWACRSKSARARAPRGGVGPGAGEPPLCARGRVGILQPEITR